MDASADANLDSWYRDVVGTHSRTHNLDLPTSCSVLLGLLTLKQAREVRSARRKSSVMGAASPGKQQTSLLAPVVFILLLLAAVAGLWNSGKAAAEMDVPLHTAATRALPPRDAPARLEATRSESLVYRTDAMNNLTAVEGPDPLTALNSYCTHPQSGMRYIPVMLAQAMPPNPGVRLGIVSDQQKVGARMSVNIYRNGTTGRWTMGDGVNPIIFLPAPMLPVGFEADPI